MTRINVVPVGASLLMKLEKNQTLSTVVKHALLPDNFPEAMNPHKRVDIELRSRTGEHGVLDVTTLLHRDPTQSALALGKIAEMTSDVCAEWNSLRDLNVADLGGEVLLFVASDTNEGLRAAVLVAAKYGHPIRYVDNPHTRSALPSAFDAGQVVVVRIPQLDLDPANGKKPNDDTWLALGELGAAIARTTTKVDCKVAFHLSGGYKALLPYFLIVAEGVQTVVRCSTQNPELRVCAQVLHESSEEPVRLPIRWLQRRPLELAMDLVKAAGAGVDIDATKLADLRGSYLEDEDVLGRRKLTEAGMIMVRTLCVLKPR